MFNFGLIPCIMSKIEAIGDRIKSLDSTLSYYAERQEKLINESRKIRQNLEIENSLDTLSVKHENNKFDNIMEKLKYIQLSVNPEYEDIKGQAELWREIQNNKALSNTLNLIFEPYNFSIKIKNGQPIIFKGKNANE